MTIISQQQHVKDMPQQIQQLQLSRHGDPATVVSLVTSRTPLLTGNDVLVALEASLIHASDFLLIKGHYGVKPAFPASLGAEGVGRVVATGSQTDPSLVGKRVLILPTYEHGTWASHVVLPVHAVVPINGTADPLQLAQLSINALTAYLVLRDYAQLMPGDWIGQTAANSAVGQYVLALAKLTGLKTLNVVRSAEAAELVRQLGGDKVIVLGEDLEHQIDTALGGQPLSLVLDTLGGSTVGRMAKFLKSQAPVVGYSSESGQTPVIAPLDLFYRRLSYHGFWVIDWFRSTPKNEIDRVIHQLSTLVSDGKVSARVGGTYRLDQFQQAFTRAQQRGRSGKFFFTFSHPADSDTHE